jgi:hypothetical protein
MADRDRFGGSERDYGPSGGPRHWQEPGVGRPPRVLQDTPIQSGGPGGEFGGSERLYTGRNPFITPNDPGMDFGAGPPGGGRPSPGRPRRPEWPSPSPLWPGPRSPWDAPPWEGGPDRPMPSPGGPRYPNPRLPYPMPDREYPNPRLPYPLEEREYQPMGYAEEDMSYMGPSPFPFPGQPRPPIGRPPWGGPDDTQWVGQPGGGEGEFDVADVGDEYRRWNSARRKYGAEAADRMMGGNVAVNRGGIMGLI